jgi:hypothetical protein
MDYTIQKNLYNILEKLQSKVNQGFYNPSQKEEAVKIITKIRTEYQTEVDDFVKRRDSIDKAYIDTRLITDQSFMIEYVSTKKDIDALRLDLLFLHKHIIIDENIRWEDQFLQLVDLFFQRKDNEFIKADFYKELIYFRFKNEDHNSKYNVDINFTLRENAFFSKLKVQMIADPIFTSDLLKYNTTSGLDLDLKFAKIFDTRRSFALDIAISKYELLKHFPEKLKESLLVNLFAINESIDAKQYLHSSYKNNVVFCSLFD